jgi:PHD/YefM family antitoxin component YafN of YafNO toxin-antitoxin module
VFKVRNIHSVTDFARNTRDHIARLQESGEPEVLTVNGRAAVVVQDAEAYERLLERVGYLEAMQPLKERLPAPILRKGRRGRSSQSLI